MNSLKLGLKAKRFFFDRAEVINRVGKKKARALSRIGAFVRRTARQSIRPAGKKNKSSPPGKPPRSHTGLLKDFLFFAYDPDSSSVVIGPVALNGRKGRDVPGILETGGKVKINGRFIVYLPRPYMSPALRANLSKIPREFGGTLRN